MDLQCILCIANSCYAFKTPTDKGYFVFWCFNCDIYWNFLDMFPSKWEISRSNGRTGDNLFKNRSLLFKTGELEYILDWCCMLYRAPMIEYNLGKICKTYLPRFPKNTFPEFFYIKLSNLASTHWHRLWHCYEFLCSIFSKGIHISSNGT